MSAGDHVIRSAKDERELERMLAEIDKSDLAEILRSPGGRRFLTRVIFRIAGTETESFHPEVKDGVCAARHDAHNEGARWVGLTIAKECALLYPEEWAKLNIERWYAAAEEARLRDKARHAAPRSDE